MRFMYSHLDLFSKKKKDYGENYQNISKKETRYQDQSNPNIIIYSVQHNLVWVADEIFRSVIGTANSIGETLSNSGKPRLLFSELDPLSRLAKISKNYIDI